MLGRVIYAFGGKDPEHLSETRALDPGFEQFAACMSRALPNLWAGRLLALGVNLEGGRALMRVRLNHALGLGVDALLWGPVPVHRAVFLFAGPWRRMIKKTFLFGILPWSKLIRGRVRGMRHGKVSEHLILQGLDI